MGLLEESIHIYEEILDAEIILKATTRSLFESTVTEIRDELESLENVEGNIVPEELITTIRGILPIAEKVTDIVDSASAFMEQGLYKEALFEYEKLLGNETVWKIILQDLASCLLKSCSPYEIIPTINEMVSRTDANDQKKSEIKFQLGLEMQKRDHEFFAQELYRSATELDPDNQEIKKWLVSNSFRQKIISKYDHLILQNKITFKQLDKALALSKKTGKSVEFILVRHFKIKKVDLSKLNKDLLPASELVNHPGRKSLKNSYRVPLSSSGGKNDVMIYDPTDLSKRDRIRYILYNYIIKFLIGITADIQNLIKRFFSANKI